MQSSAKQQYLLTDGDLKSLGYIEKKNPRKKDWHPMRLYMESQVRDVSYKKYGGQAGLEQEARDKVSKKLEMRLKVGVHVCNRYGTVLLRVRYGCVGEREEGV